ncbi:MAG: M20/M25/M40 family metallo-hydrolase [Coriobacteriales bacterium]|nr:M20/M25/M40 family metallo-hydrolase [Coriobacteriales bacterium]
MDGQVFELAKSYAQDSYQEELALLKALAVIPAPSGKEDRRAAYIRAWLNAVGCISVWTDDAQNVICQLGNPMAACYDVYSAHTDVVFDDPEPLPLVEKDGLLYAPGIGDDTACLVSLLMSAKFLAQHPELLKDRDCGVLVVANSCEEGLGNLRGTRELYREFGRSIHKHVTFDTYLGQMATSAVGSHRWQIACSCEGGHSWRDFGAPNAIVELCKLVGRLSELELPIQARTTWNVGTISGGSTINSIAEHAEMLYEYRSTDEACLSAMREAFLGVVGEARRDGVSMSAECVGERPGNGNVNAAAELALETALLDAVRTVTGEEPDCHPSSTDANIPLSMGIPAACVGTVRGGGAHTRGEWIDPTSLVDGLTLTLAIMLGT